MIAEPVSGLVAGDDRCLLAGRSLRCRSQWIRRFAAGLSDVGAGMRMSGAFGNDAFALHSHARNLASRRCGGLLSAAVFDCTKERK